MKISRLLLGWIVLSTTAITAQPYPTSLSKRVLRFTDPTWYQAASNPGKQKYQPREFDSVRIELSRAIDRKRKSLEEQVEYIGPFKNNLFHGLGKITITDYEYPFTRDKPGVLIYEGNFEQGIAEGVGFMQQNWYYQTYLGKLIQVKANYQLRFQAGELKEGFVRQDHYADDILISSLFYSGELYLKNNTPLFHGMGILYVSETSPGTELGRRIQGKHEGFYAGNFFYDQRTGFSIFNYSDPTHQQLGALTVGIVGQGELLHAFSYLPIKSDWSYEPLQSNQPVSAGFQSLFGDFSSVKKGVIYLDKENKYTGGLKNDLPHGVGYIENGNGFFDLAFWNLGKRISTRDVLKNLLPDSAMVDQHRMQKLISGKVNKKSSDLVYDAHYFGRVNASGWPIGWGLFLCTGELPDTAKFVPRGSLIGQFNGANLMEIEEGDYIKAIQGFDRKNAFVIGYRMNERYSYPCFIAADRFIGATTQVKEHYYDGTPPVAVVENEAFKEDTYRYMASLKASLEALNSRQSLLIERVHLHTQAGKSYVATSRGKINLLELKSNEIQEGDFVLYNDVFYEISSGKTFNNYVGPSATQAVMTVSGAFKNNTAYVLRGYWLSPKFEADPDRVCSYCQGKPPGKSTYTGVGYTGRNEVNVYANNSGGVNIVSKPITTITTVTVDNKPCKQCKGNEVKRRVREKVVRE